MDLFKAECRCTAIGSFPHAAAGEALGDIFKYLNDIPVWPQLPARDYLEGMCPQYSEGVPAVVLDAENGRISVDTGDSLPGAMEKFYEIYLAGEKDPLAITSRFSAGLEAFVKAFPSSASGAYAAKGHTTGPITWGLTVCDAGKKAAYFNDMLKDGVIKALARKAEWQIDLLKTVSDRVVVFVDEPYLQSYGSATVPLTEGDVAASLNEVVDSIRGQGAVAGIHCCGNTDWSLLCRTRTDIVNFDAFEYAESLSLYIKDVGDFLERGGILAWGVVPSTSEIDGQTSSSIEEKFFHGVSLLVDKGLKKSSILEQSLITPSCGAGSLSVAQCVKMLDLTSGLSKTLRGA